MTTKVGVAATFEVATVEIPISAEDLTQIKEKGLQFSLPEGAVIVVPSLKTFVEELGKLIKVPLTLPSDLPEPFKRLLTEPAIMITRLSLNTKTGFFAIDIGYYPTPPLALPGPLSFIKLKSLSVAVIHQSGTKQGPAKLQAKKPAKKAGKK